MKTTTTQTSGTAAGIFALCLSLALAGSAQAAPKTYTIDSTLSTLSLSGSYSGFALLPQSAGAMSDVFSGTIVADSSGGALTFSGGSAIIASLNPFGPFQPNTGGAAGAAPGNYGVAIPSISEFAAYRGLAFDIVSGTVMNGSTPAVTLAYTAGVLDYAGPATGPGQLNFAGATGSDSSALPASLTTVGGVERLTLPFTFALSDASGLQQTFDGSIVAFAPVPEPSAVALLITGGLFVFCAVRKRNAKRAA